MSLEKTLMKDLKEAMKAKDQAALRSIRAVKSAIMLLKTDGTGKEIDGDAEIKLLQKQIKQRKDSLEIFEKQDREDLAAKEREEIAVLERYLPAQLSEEEIKSNIEAIIAETGAAGMKDMGRVMGAANKKMAGKADGKTIASVVKTLLSN
ncbi:UNVERIFIED_CONTAM: hypothetical protein GTU68_027173 [Idotea baltica]|nr:hypothetical protein [Idotea baltica]